ncbi:tetratricopeptide repeat protein [Ruegeria sp. A3M17]|nr:tetratricopeptide repeat protein [Ruegeria sp. A3M17]
MLEDRYGSPLTTTSQTARDAYVEGIDRFLGAFDDVEEAYRSAMQTDDSFAMPHVGLARYLVTVGRGQDAKRQIALAKELSHGVSPREAAQIDIISDLIEGRAPQAYRRIRDHVADHPRDILLAQTCTSVFGLIGFSGQAGREAEQLAYTTMLKPHYGDDWWFLCQHAFAQMEAGQIGPAAENIERALELKPDSAHSAHVRAHLYYENGETDAGYAYLREFWQDYPFTAYLHCHLSWHVALWALESGDVAGMWKLFDDYVSPERPPAPPLNVLTDSVAIVHRAFLAGEQIPQERWQQLSDYAVQFFPTPGLAFADIHAALAHAMAGNRERLEATIDGAKGPAGPTVASVAGAFRALADGNADEAIEKFVSVMSEHERLGGSRAQRDIVEFSLAHALAISGQSNEARRILNMHRPHTSHDHAVATLEG